MQLSEVVLRPVITEQSVAGLDEKKIHVRSRPSC